MLPRSIQSWGVLKQAHSGSIATENSPSAQQPETVLEEQTQTPTEGVRGTERKHTTFDTLKDRWRRCCLSHL